MRRIGIFLMASIAAPAAMAAAEPPQTIALGEFREAGAMDLAGRLLPAEIAEAVVTGRIDPQWLPGQAFVVLYHEVPRDRGDRLCSMMVHAVPVRNLRAPSRRDAPADLALTIEQVESNDTIAVLPPWDGGPCSAERPYVVLREGLQGAYQEAAYRQLLSWMALAREGRELGVALSCRSDNPEACSNPRQALGTLPLEALRGIQVLNPEQLVQSEYGTTRVLVDAPLTEEDPRSITLSLGPSQPDGQTWTLSWTENDGAPPALRMSRSHVFYH